jgi:hypothetical protein
VSGDVTQQEFGLWVNGEIRDREKTMRGLKKMDTPILKGYEIFHNYMSVGHNSHQKINLVSKNMLDTSWPVIACDTVVVHDNLVHKHA